MDEFDDKLKFAYTDLKWIDDYDIFNPATRKSMKIFMSVDISEGLDQDYSVINMFKISPKNETLIDFQKISYKYLSDYFCLEQFGMFRSNICSVKQLSELFYVLCFDYFDPDNVKVVLEINTYGGEFLSHLPNIFDGNNNYGNYIFFRYKHRSDATEEKIGIRIGENKNLLVKEYKERMEKEDIIINNEDNIREITTFVKHETQSGNIVYKADNGNDDCLLPGTLIKTITGYKPIEEIKLNELVLTHLGNYKPVTNICIKDFCGNMHKMKFTGQLELNLTYNHPIYSASNNHSRLVEYSNYEKRNWKLPPDWRKTHKCVSIKEKLPKNENKIINYTELFNVHKFSYEDNVTIKNIALDKKFAKFLGLFLAEGHCSKMQMYKYKNTTKKKNSFRYNLSFGLNKKEYHLINFIKEYLKEIGIKYYHERIKGESYAISFNNKMMYELLKFCYNKDKEKIFPEFAQALGEDLKYVLEYWLEGDGYDNKVCGNRKESCIGCTTSKQLALSMRDISMSIGKYATINKKKRHRYGKPTKDQYWVQIYDEKPNKGSIRHFSDFEYGSNCQSNEKYNYNGITYNLEVKDDNSYVAEGIVVHNCTMTVVEISSIFEKYQFKEIVEEIAPKILTREQYVKYNEILNKISEYTQGVDYSSLINVNRQRKIMREILKTKGKF